jgi:hypothetical protein
MSDTFPPAKAANLTSYLFNKFLLREGDPSLLLQFT